jgi:DNA-directed RNA polymerase subunit E'/Rpb7
MEQSVLFEQKIYLSPKDINRVAKESIDTILLKHLRNKLENQCSQHGFIIPDSLEILSRSMGHLENGTYTGNIVFHVQTQGRVYNPANGTRITGTILRKNKMGLYVIYKDAIRILVPRDLHIGNQQFEDLDIDQIIEIEIRKSRFQIHDPFILSIGVYIGPGTTPGTVVVPTSVMNKPMAILEEETDAEETDVEEEAEEAEEVEEVEEAEEEEIEDEEEDIVLDNELIKA